jgi:fatty-acyl-CoA synthase
MARRDPDGFIHLVDRKSNMIITGDENVYPSDVEAVISGHPSVHDVAVVGLPDDRGERVHAVIVLREAALQDERGLDEWCKTRMAGYKRPRSFSFTRDEEMPRTATGKNLQRKLKAMILG